MDKKEHYQVMRNNVAIDVSALSKQELVEELKKAIDVICVLEDKANEICNLMNKWFMGKWK